MYELENPLEIILESIQGEYFISCHLLIIGYGETYFRALRSFSEAFGAQYKSAIMRHDGSEILKFQNLIKRIVPRKMN